MFDNIYSHGKRREQGKQEPLELSLDLDEDPYAKYEEAETRQETPKFQPNSQANAHEKAIVKASSSAGGEDQMGFGIEVQRVTFIQKWRESIKEWEQMIQVLPYWKSEINVANIVLSFTAVVSFIGILLVNFNELPNELPLFYSQTENNWYLLEKELMIFLSGALFSVELILLRLMRLVYNFDRRLSVVIAGTQVFLNLILVIAIIQIVSLVMI
ncbi:MAG: hypothetical protein ACOCXP_02490 [Candidatus Dojkabacteria bacterium]